EHDPAGMWVTSRRTGRGLLRFNGYVGAVELGRMMRSACEHYNEALAIPEVTGGYGDAVLEGLGNYKQVWRDTSADTPGERPRRQGWHTTAGSKGTIIAFLKEAVLNDLLDVPSEAAIRRLMDASVDEQDRLVKPKGVHYEDFVCLGINAYVI